MAVVAIYSDSGAQENKICHCFHCFPYLPWSDGTGCQDLSFSMLSFKLAFALSFSTLKRLFSSSSLSAIRVVSSAYLRLLEFLLAIFIPACGSSSPAFHMIYSTSKLNKQGDSIKPWQTLLSILSWSIAPFLVPTFASWSAYRFLISVQLLSCPTLCDPMNRSTPGLPVHHQLPEFTQIHVHWVSDAIQPSHPLSSPSPPAPNPSQQQSLFQWVNSLHEVAKVLEFQL